MVDGAMHRRDTNNYGDNDSFYGPSTFAFVAVVLLLCSVAATLLYLRRCRRLALQQSTLPQYSQHGHHRSLTITAAPSSSRGHSIMVYDEKMNLIANSSSPPTSPIPEIHVTFPDDEDRNGEPKPGRVVVLRISDTGSVGMAPLEHDPLPPYQRDDSARMQSLDLERMGGLREKTNTQPRYS